MGEEAESEATWWAQTHARRGQDWGRSGLVSGHLVAPLHLPFWLWLRDGIIRHWVFVPCNSENSSCRTFLKHKNSRKQELALWHLVNRLVPENAKYCIKVHIKHVGIQTKQSWSIKKYRYVCNVSTGEAGTAHRWIVNTCLW